MKVLLKIRVQNCAKWFSLRRQKFPSSKILQVYLEEFSLYFLNAKEKRCNAKHRCVGLAKRENSGASISCYKQVWAWFIKETENTAESNEFSHYCSTQGAPSLCNNHPLVRQRRSFPPICKHKRLIPQRKGDFSLCELTKLLSGTAAVVHCLGMRQMNKKISQSLAAAKWHMRHKGHWHLKRPKFSFSFPFIQEFEIRSL